MTYSIYGGGYLDGCSNDVAMVEVIWMDAVMTAMAEVIWIYALMTHTVCGGGHLDGRYNA